MSFMLTIERNHYNLIQATNTAAMNLALHDGKPTIRQPCCGPWQFPPHRKHRNPTRKDEHPRDHDEPKCNEYRLRQLILTGSQSENDANVARQAPPQQAPNHPTNADNDPKRFHHFSFSSSTPAPSNSTFL